MTETDTEDEADDEEQTENDRKDEQTQYGGTEDDELVGAEGEDDS